ncbi:pentapeptide repeat-containing protein [Dendronalium sp. ChiSLP03b]|uniref:pentapeptide repeat-containing protein n=1 Tax=Dendronalium sp. ChiSLP03b TaxID=3075381 RepID=UPI002AD33CE6|nr:pentapeptide repeat-containing protein [Dendronalium sp. ChiSLP03b]MDZ8202998.1 pentapeptide repeat-containing protein [Dendronalium sp. ChiSLP03b]
MSDNNTDTLKNWLIGLAVIFLLFIAGVFLAFLNLEGLSTEQRFKYGTPALTTTGVIFAGFAGIINAYYAAKRSEAMDKSALAASESAKAALKNAEAALKNAEIAEDKQITERFAKAIEQLGSDKIEVRLGAIYTLERIAKDSPKDHWTIMEILTAFVRENAPLKKYKEKAENAKPLINYWINGNKSEEIEQQLKTRTDIQAALTIIGQRKCENEQENQRLDLHNIDIRKANFEEANLERVYLYKANLQNATLFKANLQGANLVAANLQGADLIETKLQGAFLIAANLQEAFLSSANLEGANFHNAEMQGANISEAKLQRAYLYRADLQNAGLFKANLQGAFLSEANLQGVNFSDADLQKANLEEANLQGANLREAKNLEQHQIELAIGDRTTILPENLQRPEHWK